MKRICVIDGQGGGIGDHLGNRSNCAACHPHLPSTGGTPPLFTDFTYDNLGVPRNPANPFLYIDRELNPDGLDWVDPGLAVTVDDPGELGKFRVPSLPTYDRACYLSPIADKM